MVFSVPVVATVDAAALQEVIEVVMPSAERIEKDADRQGRVRSPRPCRWRSQFIKPGD